VAGSCDIHTENVLTWIEQHQAQWRTGSHLVVLAKDTSLTTPAQQMSLPLQVTIRTVYDAEKPQPHLHQVTVHSKRYADWRRLFAAYEATGLHRYEISDKLQTNTELVVWDDSTSAPADWLAPLWWARSADNFQGAAQSTRNKQDRDSFQQVETKQGRAWIFADSVAPVSSSLSAPLSNLDVAKTLFADWQKTQNDYHHLASSSLALTPSVVTKLNNGSNGSNAVIKAEIPSLENIDENSRQQILILIVALWLAERMVAHARRR
jgi:hypothetical protein